MSTKSRKSTFTKTRVVTSSGDVETPLTGSSNNNTPSNVSSSKSSRSSPLSPTRISRLQEKTDLQNLNDRLAAYIDKVRFLESENKKLNLQVETIQETVQREIISVKSLYEQELSDARKLLDDTSKEKARLQIDVGKLNTENEDLKLKNSKKERDLNAAEQALNACENQIADLTAKLKISETEKKKAIQEVRELKDEVIKLSRQLKESRKQLEGETLMRVDLENRCQSLREQRHLDKQIYEKELTETRSQKKIEISEIDGKLQEDYENKLQESLQELREQYEDQLRMNKNEIEEIYESKIEDLNRRVARGSGEVDGMSGQLKDSKVRVHELTSRISYLESNNASLQKRVNDLEIQLDRERDQHNAETASLRDELDHLRSEMDQQQEEYQELMDIKIALDMEISAYRKLLESEEERLNLTPSQHTPIRRSGVRGVKRKRTLVEEDISHSSFQSTSKALTDIDIVGECPDGKYIRLENKSDKDIAIGGYVLHRTAGEREGVYKFHRQLKIPSHSTTTVWSSDSSETHDAPFNLVMKNQKWPIADTIVTTLTNADGKEIVVRESTKNKELTSSSTRYGDYPQMRFSTDKSSENCCIM